MDSPLFDANKTRTKGKIFTLTADKNKNGRIDIHDLQWSYMEGDGDFRSEEVKKLRDEADIIITNPPFSLFREFLAWIVETDKKFLIIGNMNAITYKEVFPLIKNNKMWYGPSISSGDREFGIPAGYPVTAVGYRIDEQGRKYIRVKGVCWFTNLDHGRRHQPLSLMTMVDNIKFSKHKEIRGIGYQKYDNYDAIEVPFTDAIPSDYRESKGASIMKKVEENTPDYLTNTIEPSQLFSSAPLRSAPLRSATEPQTHSIAPDCHQTQDITALWESPSASSTNTAPNNLKSSDLTATYPITQTMDTGLQSEDAKLMRASLLNTKCSGIMGVPISFLDKYCPEQFEIVGLAPERSEKMLLRTFHYTNAIQHNAGGTIQSGNKVNDGPTILFKHNPPEKFPWYTCENRKGFLQVLYARILIRHK